MTADVGNAYWQGKVNLPMAMAKRKIKVDGNVASLLKLAPLGKRLYGGSSSSSMTTAATT